MDQIERFRGDLPGRFKETDKTTWFWFEHELIAEWLGYEDSMKYEREMSII